MEEYELEDFVKAVSAIREKFRDIGDVEHIHIDSEESQMTISGIFIVTINRVSKGKKLHYSFPLIYGSNTEPWNVESVQPFLSAIADKGFAYIYMFEDRDFVKEANTVPETITYDGLSLIPVDYTNSIPELADRVLWKVCLGCNEGIVHHEYWGPERVGICGNCGAENVLKFHGSLHDLTTERWLRK